ncbi:response regulator transcription factor [Leuconostoc sp. MTCC 10508]|nr:LuxR C-terminal-related transcriptional regulator [Leuconostoc sp. MTCC 10508]
MVLQNQISDILFSQNHAEKRPEEKQDYNLSEKELKILSRVARGVKIKLIALEMHLSERTIKSNLTDIYIKMNVSTGVQAVALAVKNNLIDID